MTNQARQPLSGWWQRQGRWKWWVLGLTIVVVIGLAASGSKSSSPIVQGQPVTSAMLKRVLTPLWFAADVTQRTELGGQCKSYSEHSSPTASKLIRTATAREVASDVSAYYQKNGRDNTDYMYEICERAIEEHNRPIEEQEGEERSHREKKAEEREESKEHALESSIASKHFVVTSSSLRDYILKKDIGEGPRRVMCTRSSCVVEINDYTPHKAGKIATFMGLAQSAQEQLLEDPDKVFAVLFADSRMQRATVISWDELETSGGKNVRWPAISITCDARQQGKLTGKK